MTDFSVANVLLGVGYTLSSAVFMLIFVLMKNASIEEKVESLIRNEHVLSMFLLFSLICGTVAYQNLFNHFEVFWITLRLGLITMLQYNGVMFVRQLLKIRGTFRDV